MRSSDYIPTLESWKRGSELTENDLLFDPNGKILKIEKLIREKRIIKRFNLTDDSYFDSHDGEIIFGFNYKTVQDNNFLFPFDVRSLTNDNLVEHTFGTPRLCVRQPGPLQYVNQNLEINPYVLGSLIGHAQKKVDADEMLREIEIDGRIPENYLTASYESRCELLAGLLDTSGLFNTNTLRSCFRGNNPLLMLDVKLLVKTLGGNAFIYEPKGQNIKYRCDIITDFNPFKELDDGWVKSKQYYKVIMSSMVELKEEEVIIPIVKGDKYVQGRQLIIKGYEENYRI